MHAALLPSPLGPLHAEADVHGLTALHIGGDRSDAPTDDGAFAEVARQLAEYFAGTRATFDLPLAPHGTPFERRVWAALREIPCGETRSYGELARALGSSARAVGRANARNPIAIVVPCHRVIGADGSLTGYAGGLAAKRALLEHEGALSPSLLRA